MAIGCHLLPPQPPWPVSTANPLRGLSSDAAYVRSDLQLIPGTIVLVGYSYGGAVISNAAVGVQNIKALVYIAAFASGTGDTPEQLVTKNLARSSRPMCWTPEALDIDRAAYAPSFDVRGLCGNQVRPQRGGPLARCP